MSKVPKAEAQFLKAQIELLMEASSIQAKSPRIGSSNLMRERKLFPWRTDIDLLMKRDGVDLKTAQTATILTWLYHGDLRPLADVVTDGQPLDPKVLHCLASMINKRTLIAKRLRGRGAPTKPDKSARDVALALFYEDQKAKLGSADALLKAADEFRVSEETARRAIRHWHKLQNKS
jgi:hypothetical protein